MRLRRDIFAVTRRNAIFCAPFAALERAVAHRRVDSVLCSTSCFSCSALLSSLCRSPRVACRRASARASRPLTRAIVRCSNKYEPAALRKPSLVFCCDQHGRKRDPSFFFFFSPCPIPAPQALKNKAPSARAEVLRVLYWNACLRRLPVGSCRPAGAVPQAPSWRRRRKIFEVGPEGVDLGVR